MVHCRPAEKSVPERRCRGSRFDSCPILWPRKLLRRNTTTRALRGERLPGDGSNPSRGFCQPTSGRLSGGFIMIVVLIWFFVLAVFVFVVAFTFSA